MEITLEAELDQVLAKDVRYVETGNKKHHVLGTIYLSKDALEKEGVEIPQMLTITIEAEE